MTTIYLIRHAEAEGNVYRRCHGQYDSLLTERAYQQLPYLAQRFEDVPLDYAARTIRLSPTQEVQLLDGPATLTSVEISPITVGARVEGGSCIRHHEAVPCDGSCNGLIAITLHMKDGTQIQAGKSGVGGCSDDPEDASTPYGAFIASTYYYSDMGEPDRFIDPAQVEAVEVCGAIIPVAGA